MKCSVCSNEISEKYCSKCGQYFKSEKITSLSILKDFFENIFSLEKSFIKNIKIGLLNPKILISNYWNGFRGYYYSPSRFLTIASIFFFFQIMLGNNFFGITVVSKVSQQFTILIFNIVLFSFLSFIVYLKYKKSFFEHLVLNIYSVSLWSIIFVPISVILNILNAPKTINGSFIFIYLLLIIIWNSKAFEMNKFKRLIYVTLNCMLLAITALLIYKYGTTA